MGEKRDKTSDDYFSIVQTLEAGKPVHSIVPQRWVQGKYLYWPNRKAEQLLKDSSSCPAAGWSKLLCTVKQQRIDSLTEAQEEAANLSGVTTDFSDAGPSNVLNKRFKRKQVEQIADLNFNNFITASHENLNVLPLALTVVLETAELERPPLESEKVVEESETHPYTPTVSLQEIETLPSFHVAQPSVELTESAKCEIFDKLDN
ncbi:uncharacterized protein LOC129732780 isoform X2 [Wyeomyia smithii]|uniref:uncharacterized protein LOC129732780 isoform X2 n=1 Tax=Wyeomyia smithii TaxID=174621 RepID=UPI0024681A92|nr:uncharacterized protein LOC129732780 isoform X2 [Wyeomyia smithii]